MGRLDVVEFLLEAGADINACGIIDGTPFMMATMNGDLSIAKYLLEKGADTKCAFGLDIDVLGMYLCRAADQNPM